MEFPRQEYWSGLPFPSTGDHPNTGTKPRSPALQADSLPLAPPGKPKTGTYLGNTDTDTTHTHTHTHIQNPVLEKSTFPFSGAEKLLCDEITLSDCVVFALKVEKRSHQELRLGGILQ